MSQGHEHKFQKTLFYGGKWREVCVDDSGCSVVHVGECPYFVKLSDLDRFFPNDPPE